MIASTLLGILTGFTIIAIILVVWLVNESIRLRLSINTIVVEAAFTVFATCFLLMLVLYAMR